LKKKVRENKNIYRIRIYIIAGEKQLTEENYKRKDAEETNKWRDRNFVLKEEKIKRHKMRGGEKLIEENYKRKDTEEVNERRDRNFV